MIRSILKAGATALTALAVVGATTAPAAADVTEGTAASATTVSDIAAASADNASQPSDNIACDVPKAGGGVINQRTGYFVGEVFGNDLGFGEIACARIDGGTFTLTGRASIEAFTSGRWATIRTGPSTSRSSLGGASAVAPTVTGSYASLDGSLNKYHRAKVVFATNTGRSYTMYSTPWFMAA